jgi:hypothetical protein
VAIVAVAHCENAVLIASLAKLALLNGSLRSLRCSPGAAVFVESDETTVSETSAPVLDAFRRILLQIGGANIAGADRACHPPTSSSLRDEKHVGSLLRSTAARDPGSIAPLARRAVGWLAAAVSPHTAMSAAGSCRKATYSWPCAETREAARRGSAANAIRA